LFFANRGEFRTDDPAEEIMNKARCRKRRSFGTRRGIADKRDQNLKDSATNDK
jgi:hypothetical protein